MNTLRRMVSLTLVFALTGISLMAQTQQRRAYRVNDRQIQTLLNRIENRSDVFQRSLSNALNSSRYDSSNRQGDINQSVSDFQNAINNLHANFNNRRDTRQDAENVLNSATPINNYLLSARLNGNVQTNWASLRNDLTELARLYNVTWNWSNQSYPTTGQTYPNTNQNNQPYGQGRDRLTGTFRLDTSRSEDPRSAAERATRSLPAANRQRAMDSLTARLESPESIAIDRRGRNFTIASTRAPQISFEADGTEHSETLDNGRQVRVTASYTRDQLVISQVGDRGNDYSVTFEPMDAGRRLRITRRISSDRLTQPVVVESIYDKTADVAQLDLYNGGSGYPNNPNYPTNPGSGTTSGDFVVPDGTQLVATLNDNLTTKDSRDNDRFTMTVTSPSQYEGATIEGYVTGVNRSGRVTGRSTMTFNFERIRLRNGGTYRFAGFVDSVRTANGENVRVDNEGSVQEGDNRTTTTVKRAAIGTAVGAIIGAIAGGGKGAAIGAAIGAGAGAGSVYVQGRDDLELLSGTEVTVRASAPR
ncbi:MAG TPA: YMGG-like glycine zipper-containing protein [Pyrinomonadaceae bacterium]|jgi:hypothetical protein